MGVPVICPKVATEPFNGTARVDAPVPRRFPVSQLSVGPEMANAKETAAHSTPYRAVNAVGGNDPVWQGQKVSHGGNVRGIQK